MSRRGSGPDEIKSEASLEGQVAQAHSIHLLDDDSDWLLFFFEYLSNAGYHVTAASNIDDALHLLERSHPEVLVADRDIPGMTEIELIALVSVRSPATRVILTTQRPGKLPSLQRLGSVGVDLLVKPIDWTIFLRAVERAIREVRVNPLVD